MNQENVMRRNGYVNREELAELQKKAMKAVLVLRLIRAAFIAFF